MAPLKQHLCSKRVLLLYLALVFFSCVLIGAYTEALPMSNNDQQQNFGRRSRMLLEVEDEEDLDKPIKKKKTTATTSSSGTLSSKNQTKLIKTTINGASKNQTKLIKTTINGASKNQTKLIKTTVNGATKNQTKLIKTTIEFNNMNKTKLKKLNSTSKTSSNSTKTTSLLTKKSTDLAKNNKTTKPFTKTETKIQIKKNQDQDHQPSKQKSNSQKAQKKTQPRWIDDDDDHDLVAEFRNLPTKFQETLLPDLEKISKTSQVYLTRYNKQMTKGFKPIVGNKYASTIASIVSFAFIIIPLILVSLIFNRIKAYFSLQKLLIFIQVYLSIYFSILCLSSIITGLEPLKFFYATSQSTYVCLQVMQTLCYVLYLLLLLMYLVLVFSTETGLVTKLLGLVQTFVGFSVGLHYYMKVFHRAVLRQPPKTSWKVHAMYATCFLVICLLTRADRRKKAYVEEGGEEGKKN